MDSHRCLAGTEVFLKSEKHGLYVYCCASSGFLLAIWPMSLARNVTLSCPAGWLLSEQSLAPLLGETWWPSKCLLGLLLLLQGCSHLKL